MSDFPNIRRMGLPNMMLTQMESVKGVSEVSRISSLPGEEQWKIWEKFVEEQR